MTSPDAAAHEVVALVDQIRPILHGRGEMIQGAVLADLLAMWLAGHVGPDAEALRAELLAMHIDAVRKLIPVNEVMLLQSLRAAGHA